jgi:tripartite-type tricarboxylate transporter receptor subunit TctC
VSWSSYFEATFLKGRSMRKFLFPALLAGSLILGSTALPSHAQVKSGQTVRFIVGASPGGTTDTLARVLAEEMSRESKLSIIVENKPGAGGNIAAQEVARSAPDGKTLLVAFTSHTMNASLYKKLPYDPITDFTPITLLAKVTSVLVAAPDYPAKDLSTILDGKRTGESLSIAIGGVGSSLQMDTFDFAANTGLRVTQVPYKGSSPALVDTMGGHVDLMFAPVGGALPLIESGKLRAYAVTGTQRIANLPDVPLVADSVPGFKTNYGWFGLLGPANISPELQKSLNDAAVKALGSNKIKERLAVEGSVPEGGTADEFAQFLKADMKHWAAQVQAFNIEPQ